MCGGFAIFGLPGSCRGAWHAPGILRLICYPYVSLSLVGKILRCVAYQFEPAGMRLQVFRMNDMKRKPVAVIGVGNPLFGDDGFGIRVVEELRKAPDLPEGVDVIDGGSMGVELIEYLEDYRRVIIVDAAEMGLSHGEMRVVRPEEVRSLEKGKPLSLHSTDILGTIELGRVLNKTLADIYVVAVEPEILEIREGLSPKVEAAVKAAIDEISGLALT